MDIQKNMTYLDSTTEENDSTLSNIIIILVVIGALWLVFGNSKERFSDNQNGMKMPLMPESNNVVSPDGMMGSNANKNLMAEITDATPQYTRNPSVLTSTQQRVESKTPTDMTPDERSLVAMNEISQADSKGMSCNMLGINPQKLSKYKKKFYSMYKHQVECPKNCGLGPVGTRDCYFDRLGMKKCGMEGDDQACGGIFTSKYNNPDVFALGYLALDNNNSRPCATCTFKSSGNNLNRSDIAEDVSVFDNTPLKEGFDMIEGFRSDKGKGKDKDKGKDNGKDKGKKEKFEMVEGFRQVESYDNLPESTRAADEQRMFQKEYTNANVSNFVDFENNVYQNSIGETSVDKLAEIRSGACASGTCGLQSYGKSIANVFDKLLDTPAYTNRASCNPNAITGILEDASSASGFADYNWSN